MLVLAVLNLGPWRETLAFGQINILLMGLMAADLLSRNRRWTSGFPGSGFLVGVAAGIKLTPLVFGLYFLMRKDWRGLLNMGAGFAGTVLLGWLLRPAESLQFWLRDPPGHVPDRRRGLRRQPLPQGGAAALRRPRSFSHRAVAAAEPAGGGPGRRGHQDRQRPGIPRGGHLGDGAHHAADQPGVLVTPLGLGRGRPAGLRLDPPRDPAALHGGLRWLMGGVLGISVLVFLFSPKTIGTALGAENLDIQTPGLWIMASSAGVFCAARHPGLLARGAPARLAGAGVRRSTGTLAAGPKRASQTAAAAARLVRMDANAPATPPVPPATPHRKTALVTGVGRLAGIGAGIARRLAADGWDLVLTYWQDYDARMPWGVQPDDVERLTAELQAIGAAVVALPADFQDPQAVDRLMASHRGGGRAAAGPGAEPRRIRRLGHPGHHAGELRTAFRRQHPRQLAADRRASPGRPGTTAARSWR